MDTYCEPYMYAYAEKHRGKISKACRLLERTQGTNLSSVKLFCTSEDVNSLAVTSESKGNVLKQKSLLYYRYI